MRALIRKKDLWQKVVMNVDSARIITRVLCRRTKMREQRSRTYSGGGRNDCPSGCAERIHEFHGLFLFLSSYCYRSAGKLYFPAIRRSMGPSIGLSGFI